MVMEYQKSGHPNSVRRLLANRDYRPEDPAGGEGWDGPMGGGPCLDVVRRAVQRVGKDEIARRRGTVLGENGVILANF